jgi:putative endopeptidase
MSTLIQALLLLGVVAGVIFAVVSARRRKASTSDQTNTEVPADAPVEVHAEVHGIRTDWMDANTNPGADFHRYCSGAWSDRTPLPPAFSSWGAFVMLRQQTLDQLQAIVSELSSRKLMVARRPGSNEQLVVDFYRSAMDESAVEAAGFTPLAEELKRIDAISDKQIAARVLARLHLIGVGAFFDFGGNADLEDSTQTIAWARQGSLSLGNREMYLKDEDRLPAIRQAFVEHVARMFQLLGIDAATAKSHAEAVMRIEMTLAQASMASEVENDATNVHHPMALSEFVGSLTSLDLAAYLEATGAPQFTTMNVAQPEYFKGLNELLSTLPNEDVQCYLRWRLITRFAPVLSKAFVDESFAFFGTVVNGAKELQPRWKRALGWMDAAVGDALGQLYVARYFTAEAKAKLLEIVGNVKEAMRESMMSSDWMSEPTRTAALAKLANFEIMVGYPDDGKWKDYTGLAIDTGSLTANILRAREFLSRHELSKIGKPVDRKEWGMTPHTVNAYASFETNVLVFPAGICQAPFFDAQADDAANYAAIGAVAGHEGTHPFDPNGARYDSNGNLRPWMADADRIEFEKRSKLVEDQYSTFTVPGGIHVNGQHVRGEACADLGGLALAWRAFLKTQAGKPDVPDATGFTPRQRFFIAFGQLWANKATPEFDQWLALNDEHPAARFRVNGTVAHLDIFPETFGIPQDSPIMLPTEKRCRLW